MSYEIDYEVEVVEKKIRLCNIRNEDLVGGFSGITKSQSQDSTEAEEIPPGYDGDTDDDTTTTSEYMPLFDTFTNEELADVEMRMNEFFDDYVAEYALDMSSPDFRHNVIVALTKELYGEWCEQGICDSHHIGEIREWVDSQWDVYCQFVDLPPRQSADTGVKSSYHIEDTISYLDSIPNHKQRSIEWYAVRNTLITASSVWKVFASEAQRNSLIYEKCKNDPNVVPYDDIHALPTSSHFGAATHQNPMQWGARYEPVSLMLYKHRTGVKSVGEYGCIPHRQYGFIGASPDGIVTDSTHSKYGRMIEIKNIVNREITGEPLESYWIQMQTQMEVCNLDVCDFIETRFKEYGCDLEFFGENPDVERGVILYFLPRTSVFTGETTGEPAYVYYPIENALDRITVETWIENETNMRQDCVLYHTIYWKLLQYSYCEVRRNHQWFESALPDIEELWKTIECEREEGYMHRAPMKRKLITEVVVDENTRQHFVQLPDIKKICLVTREG